ncbi:MAG: winged helix-turn-helix domain-containing protein [Candidatus Diapherotrites archaeon]
MVLENISVELQKNKKDPALYLPIINLLLEEKKPSSIKNVSDKLGLSYNTAKQRLRKIERIGFLKRGRRGIYGLAKHFEKFEVVSKPVGKPLTVNGGLRKINTTTWLQAYCSALTKVCKGMFCSINQTDEQTFLLRKSNPFLGRRMYPEKAMAMSVILSSPVFLNNTPPQLDNTNRRIQVKFYPKEWGIPLQDALGTENIKEGELGKALSKYGVVRKGSRGDSIKLDLIFEHGSKKAYIELTQTKKVKKNSRSDIKAMQLLARFYYGIKSFQKYGVPMFIVLDDSWTGTNWLAKEGNFLRENNVEIIFTDFKNKWAKNISEQIMDKINKK